MPSIPNSMPDSNIVTIDVGGQIFQTTKQTLALAGPKSLLSQLADSTHRFIDRDPELFSILLSFLRTGNLPSKAKAFDVEDLIEESKFFNIESLLINSHSNPSQFDAFNLDKALFLPLNGRDSPSTIATSNIGTLHVCHGSKITSFDWSMRKKSTILTQFSAIDSLLALTPTVAAAGATDFSGLQVLDLEHGYVKETLDWENVTRSSSNVQAIGSSGELLFVSFESGRRNSNSIMVYDSNSLKPVTELGPYEIYGADIDSAIPATKLRWVSGHNLLMASGSHSDISKTSGNIKLWDIRSGNVVWEIKDVVDCFSDVAVSDYLSGIFKVGINSGEVYYMDLRKMGDASAWVCLGDGRRMLNGKKKEGFGCKIESHASQVFCGKGGDIELWSEIVMGSKKSNEGGLLEDRVFRKNLMGRVKDMGGSRITNLAFGGNKMFVTRNGQQTVEVWQSSCHGF
ncbi:BTB/POZ domain-containing protein [Melia azedarach]|uniref:BTB/POZ domain-containing protein n=2 Tax=Melia azedarach TaxID=155640 RepID=A0ACC1XP15_MELAZ|nr:BTB/POZ domain-containing protein [Melia azedarach]